MIMIMIMIVFGCIMHVGCIPSGRDCTSLETSQSDLRHQWRWTWQNHRQNKDQSHLKLSSSTTVCNETKQKLIIWFQSECDLTWGYPGERRAWCIYQNVFLKMYLSKCISQNVFPKWMWFNLRLSWRTTSMMSAKVRAFPEKNWPPLRHNLGETRV